MQSQPCIYDLYGPVACHGLSRRLRQTMTGQHARNQPLKSCSRTTAGKTGMNRFPASRCSAEVLASECDVACKSTVTMSCRFIVLRWSRGGPWWRPICSCETPNQHSSFRLLDGSSSSASRARSLERSQTTHVAGAGAAWTATVSILHDRGVLVSCGV